MVILFGIAAAAAAIIMLNQLFRIHAIHAMVTTCISRTNTRNKTKFEHLNRFFVPRGTKYGSSKDMLVSFEFEKDSVILEVPTGSSWFPICHCHNDQEMCRDAHILGGHWYIDGMVSSVPGGAPPELPYAWRRVHISVPPATVPCRLRLSGSRKARELDHLTVSAVEDAEVYFKLCSTPPWVRLLYGAIKAISPSAADRLAQRLLWVQLRVMFFCHDTWEYRGRSHIYDLRYPFNNKPLWVKRFEKRSAHFFSKQFLRMNYFMGHVLLGMDPSYSEYEIAE
ncbi:hypothetical protein PWT90_07068 [Aphanocladium album]|nr:hypothetical protein PWT90_07068 [Aphanocladium album]